MVSFQLYVLAQHKCISSFLAVLFLLQCLVSQYFKPTIESTFFFFFVGEKGSEATKLSHQSLMADVSKSDFISITSKHVLGNDFHMENVRKYEKLLINTGLIRHVR